MSYDTWHNYGIGLRTDDLNINAHRIRDLIHMAPKFEKTLLSHISSDEIPWGSMFIDEIYEYLFDMNYWYGAASVLAEVINECEGIELCACDDFDGRQYVMYQPCYPWQLTERERSMTYDNIKDMFMKYVKVLTDDIVVIDEQAAHNGG